MATRKKQQDQLVITAEDDKLAAQYNIGYIVAALKKCSDDKFMAFIDKNEAIVANVLMANAPHLFKDYAPNLTGRELKEMFIKNIQTADPQTILKLNTTGLVKQHKLTSPETVAQTRQEKFERKEFRRQRRNENFMGAAGNIRDGLYDAGLMALSAAKFGFLGARALTNTTILPAAKILAGTLHAIPASQGTKIKASLAVSATAAALLSAPVLDSDKMILDMNLENAFLKACTPDIRNLSPANIAYALDFNASAQDHPRDAHAYQTMMAASDHNVPLIALHMIGYFESQKFSDMASNNSSASNPFQMIDTTKALLLHKYGQETSAYLSALERMGNEQASNTDKSLVLSFDAISKASMDTLNEAIKNQKMSGAIHDALAYADLSDVAAELIALDIKEKFPNITNPALSPEQIADITVQYYARDHFLGSKNYDLLSQMAKDRPDLSLTDSKAVQKSYDEPTAKRLAHIVEINPALLKKGMTAGEALSSIKSNFMDYVKKPYQQFAGNYTSDMNMRDLCLTDAGKAAIPAKVSHLDIIAYEHGYAGFKGVLGAFAKSVSIDHVSPQVVQAKNVSLSDAIEAAVQDAAQSSGYAPETSIKPKERPVDNALKASPRPKPRPSDLS